MTRTVRPRSAPLLAALIVLTLVGAACSSPKDDLRAEMREDGLSDDSIDCIFDAFDDAGIDVNDLGDASDLSPESGLAMAGCLDDVFGQMFAEAFSELGEELEQGFAEGFAELDDTGTTPSDVDLAALEDRCQAGDNEACDDLWINSPIGSAEEALAETCGGRSEEPRMGSCSFWLD